jgi:hypothetical protein
LFPHGTALAGVIFIALATARISVPIAHTVSSENIDSSIVYVLFEVAVAIVVTVSSGPVRLWRTEEKQI